MNKRGRPQIIRQMSLSDIDREQECSVTSGEQVRSLLGKIKVIIPFRMKAMLRNIRDIRDYHKKIFLPRLENAVEDSKTMRLLYDNNTHYFQH